MKDDFHMDIRCIYCHEKNGEHRNDCVLRQDTTSCTHCGSKSHKSKDCPELQDIRINDKLQYIIHENSSQFISRCETCGGRHDSKDCPKLSILMFKAEKSPYHDILRDISIECMECGSKEGHRPGCSQFVISTLHQGISSRGDLRSLRDVAFAGLAAGMLQASQGADPMSTYQTLRAQVEAKYFGKPMPTRLKEALDTVGRELSDLATTDLFSMPDPETTPRKKYYEI